MAIGNPYLKLVMQLSGKETEETNFFNTPGRNRVKLGMEPKFSG